MSFVGILEASKFIQTFSRNNEKQSEKKCFHSACGEIIL